MQHEIKEPKYEGNDYDCRSRVLPPLGDAVRYQRYGVLLRNCLGVRDACTRETHGYPRALRSYVTG
jgi:hypothetical protein